MKKGLLYLCFGVFFACLLNNANAQSNQHVKSGGIVSAVNFPGGGCAYRWTNTAPEIGLAASGSGDIASFTATNNGTSPVTATIKGMPISSDFAYIANSGSNNVSVISTATNTVIATIPVGSNPFGVSVNPASTLVYITNMGSNTVSVIDVASNVVLRTIAVGHAPKGIVVSPDGNHIYVANSGDNTVSVINVATQSVTSTIAVGKTPWGITINPNGSKIYVANFDANTVSVIDAASVGVIATIPVSFNPMTIAITPDGSTAYVSDVGTNGLTTVNTADNTVIKTIITGIAATGMIFTADGTRIYWGNFQGYFGYYDIPTTQIASYAATGTCYSISITPDGSYMYMVDYRNNAVEYFNMADISSGGQILVGSEPYSMGNFIAKGKGCNGQPVSFTITVDAPPVVTAGPVSGSILACSGTASFNTEVQQFSVSGSGLSADITANAPVDFELSLNQASGYGKSLTLKQAGGITNKTIYVRSAASAPSGYLSGKVVLSSQGIPDQNIAVSATISKLPMVDAVASQVVLNESATKPVNFTGTGSSFTWLNNTPGIGLPASGQGAIDSFIAINNGTTPVKATITVTPQPARAYGYIANINANSISVVDLATGKNVTTILVGIQPLSVAISPDGRRVYVVNENLIGSNRAAVSVIDVATNKVVANILVGDRPYGIAISPDGGTLYVANQSPQNTVSVINTASNAVAYNIETGTENPSSLALAPDGKRLYLTSSTSNNLAVINTVSNVVSATVVTGPNPLGVIVAPDGSKVFVANSSSNNVSVVDATTMLVLKNIDVGQQPEGVALSPGGNLLYVTNTLSGTVSVISVADNSVVAQINVGLFPRGIATNADGSRLYVSNSGADNVSVINTANNLVINTIDVGAGPYSFGNFITQNSSCEGKPVTFDITVNPTPAIIAASSVAATKTTYGTPSSSLSFPVSGTNLQQGILVTPPSGFEVSADGKTFAPTVILGDAGNTNNLKVYFRLSPAYNAGTYAGNITLTTAGAQAVNVAIPASTIGPALLDVTPNNIEKTYGTVLADNANSTAFITGSDQLKNGNTITSISLTYGNGGYSTAGVGKYSTINAIINAGANNFLASNYAINYLPGIITVTPAQLTITANDVLKPYGTALTTVTGVTAFTVTGLQNQQTIASVTMIYRDGSAAADTYGLYPGSVVPTAATGGTVTLSNYTITYVPGILNVVPAATINTSGSLPPLTTIYGTPSASAGFNVSGNGLSSAIVATAPPGFEISNDNMTFSPTISIGSAGGTSATTVYIRLKAISVVGTYSGSILLSSDGIKNAQAVPAGTVTPATLIITADNKRKVAGDANPVLTVSYAGFVNNETATQLSSVPHVSTPAVTTSAAGVYLIMANGAVASNYDITYVSGILTVDALPPAVVIPNAFSPNGDGTNDLWNIPALAYYTNNVVKIYNRYGNQVFTSVGYTKPWDGSYNGGKLPAGVYYYIINLNKIMPALSGYVTIIR